MAYTEKIQMRRALYRLKREYGNLAHLYRVTSATNNVQTGEIEKTYQVIAIKRAILLPERLTRKFSYDLTFLAANKNFQYGAYYDLGVRDVIIEMRDLPKGLDIKLDWSLVYNHKRYEIRERNLYDYNLAVYMVCHEVENQLPFEWHNKDVNTEIELFEQVEGVKS